MGLFQKKPDVSTSLPLYRLGSDSSFLIIGLGNPGKEYERSRHNTGFMVVDQFAKLNNFPSWLPQKRLKSMVSLGRMNGKLVILAKPTTFMNDSGQAAALLKKSYKIPNQQILVVYDELALPFGQLRTRRGGQTAGHNGIKSLVEYLGEDFNRLRVGITRENQAADHSKYVLGNFNNNDRQVLPTVVQEACVMISEYIYSSELPRDTRTII